MCDARDFHAALSRLAYAHAENTILYILDEAQRIDEQCRSHHWNKLNEQFSPADRMLIAEMMSDPTVARCVIQPDGVIVNINEQFAGWLKRPKAAMLGTCVWSYFPAHVVECRKCVMYRVLETQLPHRVIDQASNGGHPLETVALPLVNGCVMVLCRRIGQNRVFEEAISDEVRVIG